MHIVVCRICEQVGVNLGKGGSCPYCGSPSAFLVPIEAPPVDRPPLTEVERSSLEDAIVEEQRLAQTIRGAVDGMPAGPLRELAARLSVLALTRVAVLCRLVKTALPADVRTPASGELCELLDRARSQCDTLGPLYADVARGATSVRVRDVAHALAVGARDLGEALDEAAWRSGCRNSKGAPQSS